MNKELVFRESLREVEIFLAARRVEDALCALLERRFELENVRSVFLEHLSRRVAYYWYDICWLVVQAVRQLLVECDQVGNVNVAVVLFRQDILAYLVATRCQCCPCPFTFSLSIPVDVVPVEMKFQHECDELFLCLPVGRISIRTLLFSKQAERVD